MHTIYYLFFLRICFLIDFFLYLQNGGAKDGLDMNLSPAWQKGYTGKGVVVSILDDGIQTNHPDLAQNYVSISPSFLPPLDITLPLQYF